MTTTEIQPSFHLILTTNEKVALLNLIHVAVKAQGLDVALNAVVLAQKITQAPELKEVSEPSKA